MVELGATICVSRRSGFEGLVICPSQVILGTLARTWYVCPADTLDLSCRQYKYAAGKLELYTNHACVLGALPANC